MIDEGRIRAALQAEAESVDLVVDLWPVIRARAHPRSIRTNWYRPNTISRAIALLTLALALMGAVGYSIVAPRQVPLPLPATKLASVDELERRVGFRVLVPSYLPPGVQLQESRLEADGVQSSSKMRIVALYFMTSQGSEGITLKQWRADVAAPFPPGDAHEAAFRTDDEEAIPLAGVMATVVSGDLNGQPYVIVYWYDGEIDYSLAGFISRKDALKVAGSLH